MRRIANFYEDHIHDDPFWSPFVGFLLIAAPIALGALTRPLWGFILFGVEMIPGALWAIGQTTWWEIQENREFYGERYRDAWWFAAKAIGVSIAITSVLALSIHGWSWALLVVPALGLFVAVDHVRSEKRRVEEHHVRRLADELSEDELRDYFREHGKLR